MRLGGQHHVSAALPLERPGTVVQEVGLATGPVWTVAGNLAPPGFDPRIVQFVANRYTD
jgi:hypothetical protein